MFQVELWGCCAQHTASTPVRFDADGATLEDVQEEALGYLYWAGATGYRVLDDAGSELVKRDGIDPLPF